MPFIGSDGRYFDDWDKGWSGTFERTSEEDNNLPCKGSEGRYSKDKSTHINTLEVDGTTTRRCKQYFDSTLSEERRQDMGIPEDKGISPQ